MRRYFIAGLLVWLPIWVTYVVIKFIVQMMDGTLALLPAKYQPEQLFGTHIPGLGLVFTVVILFATGIIVTHFLGHKLVAVWERLLSRIPLIRSIHSAVKQVLHAVLQPTGQSFRKVVMLEYPRKGIWSVGFLTSTNFTACPTDEPMHTVFVPTTPNPTSGFFMIIPAKDTYELKISVEEALRMVISLGVVMPDHMTPNTVKAPSKSEQ